MASPKIAGEKLVFRTTEEALPSSAEERW